MPKILQDLKYYDTHEWISPENDSIVRIGITDYAQEQLGDVVFVELPSIGTTLEKGDQAGVIESVKAASDIYSPVSGTVASVNERLTEQPELVNQAPYDEGWLFTLKLSNSEEVKELLSSDNYKKIVE